MHWVILIDRYKLFTKIWWKYGKKAKSVNSWGNTSGIIRDCKKVKENSFFLYNTFYFICSFFSSLSCFLLRCKRIFLQLISLVKFFYLSTADRYSEKLTMFRLWLFSRASAALLRTKFSRSFDFRPYSIVGSSPMYVTL